MQDGDTIQVKMIRAISGGGLDIKEKLQKKKENPAKQIRQGTKLLEEMKFDKEISDVKKTIHDKLSLERDNNAITAKLKSMTGAQLLVWRNEYNKDRNMPRRDEMLTTLVFEDLPEIVEMKKKAYEELEGLLTNAAKFIYQQNFSGTGGSSKDGLLNVIKDIEEEKAGVRQLKKKAPDREKSCPTSNLFKT